jgi:hypothetical protein
MQMNNSQRAPADEGLRLSDVAYIDPATHERMSGTRVLPGAAQRRRKEPVERCRMN